MSRLYTLWGMGIITYNIYNVILRGYKKEFVLASDPSDEILLPQLKLNSIFHITLLINNCFT